MSVRIMMSVRITRLYVFLIVVLSGSMAGPAASAEALDRRGTANQINELMRQDQRAQALPLCRQYTAQFPQDPVMLYNLACLENTVGEKSEAEAAYRRALAAGFTEFAMAAVDPDLQGELHQVILAINQAEQQRLQEFAADTHLTLDLEKWSEPRNLIPHGSAIQPDFTSSSPPQIRLLWHDTGLEFELTAAVQWAKMFAQDTRAPWQGGPGLVLSLGMLANDDDIVSTNHFLFAFGFDTKGGVGGMYVATTDQWQQVVELAPKIKIDEQGRMRMTAIVPWQALVPYNPLVDTPIGINATLIRHDGNERHRASLLPTNDTLDPTARQRRMSRLSFRTDSISTDLILGKLSDSISRNHPLDLDLVIVSTEAGQGVLSLNFTDQAGRSVLPEGPITGTLALAQGTNRISRQADFSSLNIGGYIMQAELVFPSGQRKTWASTVLQLPDHWQDRYIEENTMVALAEQPTVRYLLTTIEDAATNHPPRRNPGAIVTTLIDLDQMLGNVEESGTILPDKGSFVFVYPGARGQDMICHMYLPAGRNIADGVNPVVVLGQGNGVANRVAARIGRNYEHGDQTPTLKTGDDNLFPVYLVPDLPTGGSITTAEIQTETDACLNWALDYFQTLRVSVVGIDERGASALQYAGHEAHRMNGVLVFAGQNLNPWPLAQPEFIRQKLGPAPAELNFTWIEFPSETRKSGQAPDILQALKDLNYPLNDVQEVRGSLSLSQVADRIVVWAEGLR